MSDCNHDWVPMAGAEVCYGCNQIRRPEPMHVSVNLRCPNGHTRTIKVRCACDDARATPPAVEPDAPDFAAAERIAEFEATGREYDADGPREMTILARAYLALRAEVERLTRERDEAGRDALSSLYADSRFWFADELSRDDLRLFIKEYSGGRPARLIVPEDVNKFIVSEALWAAGLVAPGIVGHIAEGVTEYLRESLAARATTGEGGRND